MDHRDSETQLCQEDPDSLDAPGDPTMAQCCIRDMQQQRKSAALRRQLEQVDVSTQRQQVLLHAVSPATLEQNFNADLASELHDDTDHELARLRDLRLQQLKAEADQKQELQRHGHGQLNQHTAKDAYGHVTGKECSVVCHVAISGFEVCDQLDEHLESLAHSYQQTYFCRVAVARSSALQQQLGLEVVPALVCLKEGAIVGRAPLSMFGTAEQLYEEQVELYLKRLGVLRAEVSGGAAEHSSDEASEEEGDWQAPCEVCGRRYPHQHVKAIYQSAPADEGSDFDSD